MVVAPIIVIVTAQPTCGYRRIASLMNRKLRAQNAQPVNQKRVYPIMLAQNLLLARRYTERSDRAHNGKVVTMRWCSDGFDFARWNGDNSRGAFIIDAHDRKIVSRCAVSNAGISGSDVRHMMPAAVEARSGGHRAPHCVEMLSDNGSPYIAHGTRTFAGQIGLKPCFTLMKNPPSNGISGPSSTHRSETT